MTCIYLDKIITSIQYVLSNFAWVLIGFIFGIGVYWSRLDQFRNELKSILNLVRKKYPRGEIFKVRSGVTITSVDGTVIKTLDTDCNMIAWHNRGIDWFFCRIKGLIRSRIIYAAFENDRDELPKLFIVSHFYITR